ncbi:GntR family transcriptional regulator [Streptomyces sp. NPDC055006]
MTRKDRGSPRTDSPSRDGAPGVSYTGRGVHRIAVEALARRIFDGTYAEGDLLDLPGLMAELDVSQTVLREAIKVLPPKACWTPGRRGDPRTPARRLEPPRQRRTALDHRLRRARRLLHRPP